MATLERQIGSTSEIVAVFVPNATVSTGAGLANISASSLSISWWRSDMTSTSTYTASTGTLGTWGASTVAQVNSTFALGWYQVSVPNGVFVSGDVALMHLYGQGSMAPVPVLFDITRDDKQQYASSKVYSSTSVVLAVTNPVSVSTMSTPVDVSSASVDFGVSTIAVAQKLVGVSTLSVPVGVSSYSRNAGVSTVAILVGVSTLAVPVGVSSASVDFGVSTIAVAEKLVGVSTVAASQKLVGVSTMTTPTGVSSASVEFGVSTLAVTEKLVGVSSSIMVSSNIAQINGVTIVGDGNGTPWGPA